jgi:hypothetical protein
MKYRKEWQGRLRVHEQARVFWDGEEIGRVWSRHKEGAISQKGMVTNKVWYSQSFKEEQASGKEYASMEQAIEVMLPKE